MQNESLYWGLKFSEWITIAGLILGPVFAVIISIWADVIRDQKDKRIQIMKTLLSTRQFPADPSYNLAINMIPVDFNRHKEVMEAHKAYMEQVNAVPSDENRQKHDAAIITKQTKLIFKIMQTLGYKTSELDLQSSGYSSQGSVYRDNLYLESLRANSRIADALEKQVSWVENSANSADPQNKPKSRSNKKAP